MKTTFIATILASAAIFASAAPLDEMIKREPIRRQVAATGTAVSAAATGTGVAVPLSTGGSSCSPDGAVICNGESQFGLCNFGKVVFQSVAAGTKCVDGEITT